MKNELTIRGLPTYQDNTKIELRKINLFFGKNGSGKSTLCKFIKENPGSLSDEGQNIIVYDAEYRRSQIVDGMKGIYTFGDKNPTIINEIDTKTKEMESLEYSKKSDEEKHNGLIESRKTQFDEFSKEMWSYKEEMIGKYDPSIFKGYNGSKEKFAKEILEKYDKCIDSKEDPSKIKEYYEITKQKAPEEYEEYSCIEYMSDEEIDGYAAFINPILSQSDKELNDFYSKLCNLDWIKQGREYLSLTDGHCPFCNTILTNSFKDDINAIFDEIYNKKIEKMNEFIAIYSQMMDDIVSVLVAISSKKYENCNYVEFEEKYRKLATIISDNRTVLNNKSKEPAKVYDLVKLNSSIDELNIIIDDINSEIKEHNDLVKDRKQIPAKLSELIMIVFCKKYGARISGQLKQKKNFDESIKKVEVSIADMSTKIATLQTEINDLNKKISNVEFTVENINNLLYNFGFKNFSLVLDKNNPGTYGIKRLNGSSGDMKTLSEGECKLVTFLYFYHLIHGTLDPSEAASKYIVVMDDPVTSMDGDTMNIVSTLTKNILQDTIHGRVRVDQLLIFTHNVFYYREIENRIKNNKSHYYYHLIKKIDSVSTIKTTKDSTVYSNYELMWIEYMSTDSPVSSFNCMRRILEYYFKTLCGDDTFDSCRSNLDTNDQVMFDYLVNMINSGSHSIFDPVDTYVDETTVVEFKRIFKRIFELNGNMNHYNHMIDRCSHMIN